MFVCGLLEGHIGSHVDGTTRNRTSWPRANGEVNSITTPIQVPIFHRCSEAHPTEANVFCGMKKDHQGYHRECTKAGTIWEWPNGYNNPKPEPKPEQPQQQLNLENEVSDNMSLLDWAKSRNPKLFKTPGRTVASEQCMSANRDKHKECGEPWCDCPCHDDDGMVARVNRQPWGICLGLILLILQIPLF